MKWKFYNQIIFLFFKCLEIKNNEKKLFLFNKFIENETSSQILTFQTSKYQCVHTDILTTIVHVHCSRNSGVSQIFIV